MTDAATPSPLKDIRDKVGSVLHQMFPRRFEQGLASGAIGFSVAILIFGIISAPYGRDFALLFVVQLAAGAVLLILGLPFARRQIMSQYWFNHKAEIYSDIIRQLGVIRRWAEETDKGLSMDSTFIPHALDQLEQDKKTRRNSFKRNTEKIVTGCRTKPSSISPLSMMPLWHFGSRIHLVLAGHCRTGVLWPVVKLR